MVAGGYLVLTSPSIMLRYLCDANEAPNGELEMTFFIVGLLIAANSAAAVYMFSGSDEDEGDE
jgi:hypothetical protein